MLIIEGFLNTKLTSTVLLFSYEAQKHNYYQILHDFKTKMIVICYSTSQCGWVVYSESHTLGGGSGA